MKNIACYCRTSTDDQHGKMQRAEARIWLKANRIKSNSYKWYVDRGVSGLRESRPALDEMLRHCDKGKIDTVVVFDLSRLARSVKQGLEILGHLCEKKIRFVSIRQNIDFHGLYGEFMATILLAVGSLERSITNDRLKSGIRAYKKEHGRWGRKPNTKKRDKVQQLHDEGLSVNQIAGRFKCTRQNIYYLLGLTR